MADIHADVAIIGAGYYGCAAAIEIKTLRPELEVVILERANKPFSRASSTNQGQLHAGYMYSKFPDLARECVQDARIFAQTYPEAVNEDAVTYYGIHKNSEILSDVYEGFCRDVGLPLHRLSKASPDFFGPALTAVYATEEKTFDNYKLQQLLRAQLIASGVKLIPDFEATSVQASKDMKILSAADGRAIQARLLFNAAFADVNALHKRSSLPLLPLEHAVFLHFLIKLPEQYKATGLIVVRGAYAALVPVGNVSGATHIFASGRYRLLRSAAVNAPTEVTSTEEINTRYQEAVADAVDYMPALQIATLNSHTVGTRTNYVDPITNVAASRAVVLEDYGGLANYHVIVGGKVTCLPEINKPLQQIVSKIF